MKKTFGIFVIVCGCVLTSLAQEKMPSTTILKPTLTVRAVRDLNYWKQPNAKNFWSWMPQADFVLTGPIPDASYVTVSFTTPDGKPWFSWDSGPLSAARGYAVVESEAVPYHTDKRTTIETGVFGFKVTLKNNLMGTSKELYNGKFKVNKKFAGTPHPDFKNQFAFYVDQDWSLPIGYLSYDTAQEPNAPWLIASMWFRGEYDRTRLAAYLFHNGKQISSTAANNQGGSSTAKSIITVGDDKREFRYDLWKFAFMNVRGWDTTGHYKSTHLLYSNPGSYEVKVLLDGDLVRTASFTVGSDGKIVDNGIAANNGFGGFGVVIPVKVVPGKEGSLNLQSWKTDAFYGNPLTGFSVQ